MQNAPIPITKQWGRINEVTEITGIKRGKIYNLISNPENNIKTATLKEPGQNKGTRLIHIPSLLDFIESRIESI